MATILWVSHAPWTCQDDLAAELLRRGHSLVHTVYYGDEAVGRAAAYDVVVLDYCGWQVPRWTSSSRGAPIVVRLHGPELNNRQAFDKVTWKNVASVVTVSPACARIVPKGVKSVQMEYALSSSSYGFVERSFNEPHRLAICASDVKVEGLDSALNWWLSFDGRDGGAVGKWNLMLCSFRPCDAERKQQIMRLCSHHGLGNRIGLFSVGAADGFWAKMEVAWSPGGAGSAQVPFLKAALSGCYPVLSDRPAVTGGLAAFKYGGRSQFLERLSVWNKLSASGKLDLSRQCREIVVARNGGETIALQFEKEALNG